MGIDTFHDLTLISFHLPREKCATLQTNLSKEIIKIQDFSISPLWINLQ